MVLRKRNAFGSHAPQRGQLRTWVFVLLPALCSITIWAFFSSKQRPQDGVVRSSASTFPTAAVLRRATVPDKQPPPNRDEVGIQHLRLWDFMHAKDSSPTESGTTAPPDPDAPSNVVADHAAGNSAADAAQQNSEGGDLIGLLQKLPKSPLPDLSDLVQFIEDKISARVSDGESSASQDATAASFTQKIDHGSLATALVANDMNQRAVVPAAASLDTSSAAGQQGGQQHGQHATYLQQAAVNMQQAFAHENFCFSLASNENAAKQFPVVEYDIVVTMFPGRDYLCRALRSVYKSARPHSVHLVYGKAQDHELAALLDTCPDAKLLTTHLLPEWAIKYAGDVRKRNVNFNYYQALISVPGDRPLLVLEDDAIIADHFEPVFSCLLVKAQLFLKQGFIMNLYNGDWGKAQRVPPDPASRIFRKTAREKEVEPDTGIYHRVWYFGTQGFVFSDAAVKKELADFFYLHAVNDEFDGLQDWVIRDRAYTDEVTMAQRGKIPLISLERSLAQHIGVKSSIQGNMWHFATDFLGASEQHDNSVFGALRTSSGGTPGAVVVSEISPMLPVNACTFLNIQLWDPPDVHTAEMVTWDDFTARVDNEEHLQEIALRLRLKFVPQYDGDMQRGGAITTRCRYAETWVLPRREDNGADLAAVTKVYVKQSHSMLLHLNVTRPEHVLVTDAGSGVATTWLATLWPQSKITSVSAATSDSQLSLHKENCKQYGNRMAAKYGEVVDFGGGSGGTARRLDTENLKVADLTQHGGAFDVVIADVSFVQKLAADSVHSPVWLTDNAIVFVPDVAADRRDGVKADLQSLAQQLGHADVLEEGQALALVRGR